ncbi:hypothetical protein V565_082680 [Rhizoctonia solani 123E]|uniref:Uncharacterized protein n=1 Tax=Rhizoctonia solani 123E TaxID=1423351 RepID=A0A074SJY3_9AGAM|nr:hypothetical protein V565_082680 [Rhizoctonia solani 123E]
MASPTSRSTSRRTGDNGQPGYMALSEASQAKQCPPVAHLKRSVPTRNSSTTPQRAAKAPLSPTISSRTSANTHAPDGITTKKAERMANEAPKLTIETNTPRDEVYSTTCSTWSFLQCSPASSLSISPLPPYEEACVDAPDYERDEGLPLAGSLLGACPEFLSKLPVKALTKPGSNGIAKTGEPVNEKASPLSILDDLALDILGDIDDIMQSIGIDVYAICRSTEFCSSLSFYLYSAIRDYARIFL